MTLHWVDQEKGKPISMLLDFLHVAPGDGVGLRCGEALFKRLRSFDISSRLMCTIADGASDAIVASKELSRLLHEFHGCNILPSSHILRCMVHTFQLATKAALDVMCPTTMKLRKTLKSIHKCKTHRALFKRYSRTMFDKGEREPPCMDAVTRWNSTLVMYQQAIELKDVINWTITECSVPTNVNEYLLTREEWTHVECMIEWLAMPTKISMDRSTPLSHQRVPFSRFLDHCNNYVAMDITVFPNMSNVATLKSTIRSKSSMFAIFDKVPRNHKVIAIKDCYVLGSKVHMLLLIFIARLFQKYEFQYSISTNFCTLHNLLYMEFDNRVPAQNNPIEEKLDIDEVEFFVGNTLSCR